MRIAIAIRHQQPNVRKKNTVWLRMKLRRQAEAIAQPSTLKILSRGAR